MIELSEPSEIPENQQLQEYNYCDTNEKVIYSKAWKLELFNVLKEEFWDDWKEYYNNIYELLNWININEEDKNNIKENIINNSSLIEKLENVLYKKLNWTSEQHDSGTINLETIKILLSNAIVKQDISEVIWMDELDKILEEYKFWETIDWINNEDSEIHIEEDLEKYIVLKINSNNYYIINKETKEKQECSGYEKITFWDKEIFIVKRKSDRVKLWWIWDKWNLEQLVICDEILTDLIDYWYLVIKEEGKYILLNENFEENEKYYFEDKKNLEEFDDKLSNKDVIEWKFWLKVKNKDWEWKIIFMNKNWKIEEYDKLNVEHFISFDKNIPIHKKIFELIKLENKEIYFENWKKIDIWRLSPYLFENNWLVVDFENILIKKDSNSFIGWLKDFKDLFTEKKNFYWHKSSWEWFKFYDYDWNRLYEDKIIDEYITQYHGKQKYLSIKIENEFIILNLEDWIPKEELRTEDRKEAEEYVSI